MSAPAAALELVRRFEGCRLEAYKCPGGVWTIGFGTTRDVIPGMRITREEAERLLLRDLTDAAERIRPLVAVELTENQWAALASFAHNCGVGAFERSMLRDIVNRGELAAVPNELMRWVKSGRRTLPGLVARRRAEGLLWAKP